MLRRLGKIAVAGALLVSLGGCMSMMGMQDMQEMHEQMHGGHGSGESAKDKTESQGDHSH